MLPPPTHTHTQNVLGKQDLGHWVIDIFWVGKGVFLNQFSTKIKNIVTWGYNLGRRRKNRRLIISLDCSFMLWQSVIGHFVLNLQEVGSFNVNFLQLLTVRKQQQQKFPPTSLLLRMHFSQTLIGGKENTFGILLLYILYKEEVHHVAPLSFPPSIKPVTAGNNWFPQHSSQFIGG